MTATTQLETVNVNAQKCYVLRNQQPSSFEMEKVQRPGDIPHRVQVNPKREGGHKAHKIWSILHGDMQQGLNNKGITWYYSNVNSTEKSAVDITLEVIERFHEKWVVNGDCWEWNASLAGKGYGQMKIPGTRKQEYAHRISYMIHCGEIKNGLSVCHACDNPKCVKPSHLFLGTTGDNLQDMKNKDRHLRGERNKKAILTEAQVRRIHELSKSGMSQGKIGRSFNISQSQVHKILHGKRWEHIYNEINRANTNDVC